MRRFQKYTEFVYGKPSPEIFAHSLLRLSDDLKRQLLSDDSSIQKAAEDLVKLLPLEKSEIEASEGGLPQESDIAFVRRQTMKELSGLLDLGDIEEREEKEYTADEIRDFFQAALNNLQAEG